MIEHRTVSTVIRASWLVALAACSLTSVDHAGPPAASRGAEATPEPTGPASEPATSTGSAVPSSTSQQSLRDAQIVRIADELDAREIAQGKLALSRARDPRVLAFAQRVVLHHTDNRQHSELWQRRAGVTAEASAAVAQLQSDATRALHALEDLEVSIFDATYLQSQLQQHQRALDLLDRQLLPNTTNPELKTRLESMRNLVENHIGDAQQLFASFGNQVLP